MHAVAGARASRRGTAPLIAAAIALVAAVLTAIPAAAAEFRTGDRPRIASDETVTDDVYLAGGAVVILGTVRGDALVSAGTLDVPGRVNGSVSAIAGRVRVSGDITRSLRVAGGSVDITGNIGGDVIVLGSTVTIAATASVDGDVIVTGGDVSIFGPVRGDVRGNIDSLTINARVDGDVLITAQEVRLRPEARIAGDLRYTSREEARIDSGATVTGTTRQTRPARFYPGDNLTAWFSSAIFRLLCALVAGVVVILVMPRAAAAIADGIRDTPTRSFLAGLLLALFVPVLIVLGLLTIVGIPIALIILTLYLSALYLSQVFLGLALGRIILPGSWDTGSRGYNLLAMTIGVIILAGLRLVPVPFLGAVVAAITAVLGLGAIVVGLRRARPRPAQMFPQY